MSDASSFIDPLLQLFETALADVRFADVDAQALARAAADVTSAEAELNAAQVVVDAARAQLQERQEALLQAGHRALAYARVYAETDDALSERVSAITLPRPVRRARPGSEALVLSPDPAPQVGSVSRPRGRPRKVPADAPFLEALAPAPE